MEPKDKQPEEWELYIDKIAGQLIEIQKQVNSLEKIYRDYKQEIEQLGCAREKKQKRMMIVNIVI